MKKKEIILYFVCWLLTIGFYGKATWIFEGLYHSEILYQIYDFLPYVFFITLFYGLPLLLGCFFHKRFRFWFVLYFVLVFNFMFWSFNLSSKFNMAAFNLDFWTDGGIIFILFFVIVSFLAASITAFGSYKIGKWQNSRQDEIQLSQNRKEEKKERRK